MVSPPDGLSSGVSWGLRHAEESRPDPSASSRSRSKISRTASERSTPLPPASPESASVHRWVVGVGRHPRQRPRLTTQHRVPELVGLGVERVVGQGIDHEPGTLAHFLLKLIGRPPGIPCEDTQGTDVAGHFFGCGVEINESELAKELTKTQGLPGIGGASGEQSTERQRAIASHRPTVKHHRRLRGVDVPVGQDRANVDRGWSIDHHAEGACLVVVDDQHHGAIETVVGQGRGRDEKLAGKEAVNHPSMMTHRATMMTNQVDDSPEFHNRALRLGGSDMGFGVRSEVGHLRQVIVHRPGLELSRLTPGNVHELLFDDVMWAERARTEHDAFVHELEARGVVVHYFNVLLGEALQSAEARSFLLERVVGESTVGPTLVEPLRELIDAAEPQDLADYMIGGILKKDVPAPARPSLLWQHMHDEDFVLSPLPNHLFQRDNSAWVHRGVSINPMAKPARKRETVHSRVIYNFHPMFSVARDEFVFYYGNDDEPHEPATCEGGDIMVIGNGTVMVGMGERTTPQGVEILAQNYFAQQWWRRDFGHRR